MKSASIGVIEERYFDCPYCGRLNSDNGAENSDIGDGCIVPCEFCGKKVRLRG
jgi:uncharacterized Zn-finger protein